MRTLITDFIAWLSSEYDEEAGEYDEETAEAAADEETQEDANETEAEKT